MVLIGKSWLIMVQEQLLRGWSLSHYSNRHNYKVYWFSVNWTNTFKRLDLFLSDLPLAIQGF